MTDAEKKYLCCKDCENFNAFCRHLRNVKIDPEATVCRYGNQFVLWRADPYDRAGTKRTLKRTRAGRVHDGAH